MLVLNTQPSPVSFSRNPIVYKILSVDGNGNPYGATGKKGIIQFSTITEPSLQFNEELTFIWTTPTDSYSYTFTGHPTPTQDNQLLSSPHALNATEYAQAWISTFESHPVISSFFTVESFSFGNFVGIRLEDKSLNPDFDISFDYSDASEFSESNFSTEDYQASNLPNNYEVKIDVFFQSVYSEGGWSHVTRLENITPNSDGLIEINLEDVLDAEFKGSQLLPDLPTINSSQMYLADNLRRFYIRYSEFYGSPQVEQNWEFTDTRKAIFGGIDQERFASSDFFSQLNIDNSFLTWSPNQKTVHADAPEYLAWYNYTGGNRNIALRLTTYDELNQPTEAYLYDDIEEFLLVPDGQTAIIPVGFTQLGLTEESIRKYTIEVVNYIPSDIPGVEREEYSSKRTYYVDCLFDAAERIILYLDGFGLPQVLRLTGKTRKDLTVSRETSVKILDSNYSRLNREDFQHDVNWGNIYTYRTGWLSKLEADAHQQLLIDNRGFEIINDTYFPILITDKKFSITEQFQYLHALEFRAMRALQAKNYSNNAIAAEECCYENAICYPSNQIIDYGGYAIAYN